MQVSFEESKYTSGWITNLYKVVGYCIEIRRWVGQRFYLLGRVQRFISPE